MTVGLLLSPTYAYFNVRFFAAASLSFRQYCTYCSNVMIRSAFLPRGLPPLLLFIEC